MFLNWRNINSFYFQLGGLEMDKSDYNGVYEELVELLGVEVTLKIHEYFKGQQVNFPMRVHSKEYV